MVLNGRENEMTSRTFQRSSGYLCPKVIHPSGTMDVENRCTQSLYDELSQKAP